MVHVVVLGAGIGGLPTVYELWHLLPKCHRIKLISDCPKFTFIPSLPWVADFGDKGLIFIAAPVLPDPVTGKRRSSVVKQGRWVSWIKAAFEKFFLTKMQLGMSVPWFERWGLRIFGLSLVEPIPDGLISDLRLVAVNSRFLTTAHKN